MPFNSLAGKIDARYRARDKQHLGDIGREFPWGDGWARKSPGFFPFECIFPTPFVPCPHACDPLSR